MANRDRDGDDHDLRDEKQAKIRASERRLWRRLGLGMAGLLLLLGTALHVLTPPHEGAATEVRLRSSAAAGPGAPVPGATSDHRAAAAGPSEAVLEAEYRALEQTVRALKATGVIMETDPASLRATARLQAAARALLVARYGRRHAYRVRLDLEFPPSVPDFATRGKDGVVVFELAPVELIPVSVFTFLEIARTWKSGSFHRNAGHVLQAQVDCGVAQSLPFQEYSDKFPHAKGTTGYCGRPSGPCFYISIMDNTRNHGPGSQQKKNPYEADANFGRVVEGWDDVVPRIHSVPQREWLDKKNLVWIRRMTILVPRDEADPGAGFVEWKPAVAAAAA